MALDHPKSTIMASVFFLTTWCTALDSSYCYNDVCYELSENKLTYELAITWCEKRGGALATIRDSGTNSFLYYSVCAKESCWIGLQDMDRDGVYEWHDGSSTSFSNWYNTADRDDKAVYMGSYSWWFDTSASSTWLPATCMISTTPSPTPQSSQSSSVESTETSIWLPVILCMLILVILLLMLNLFILWTVHNRRRLATSIELADSRPKVDLEGRENETYQSGVDSRESV